MRLMCPLPWALSAILEESVVGLDTEFSGFQRPFWDADVL